MTTELPKTFDPAEIEARWYAHWESAGLFRPERPGAEPWTIVNPPPNVTGSLHIGHALDNTLQDILVRHARLQGKDARWVVGTDHAGIATQMVVERQLNERQDKRTNYSRDEFVAKVWEWKAESGGEITRQLRRLGCSMDWANERFTMDEGFSKAVLKVFVDLYNQGLLYRDKRLVNWDPGLGTAISDLEVETREVQGQFWTLRYPLADGALTGTGSKHIKVATTRPETMLADMAVAVHPEDPRYRDLIGQHVILPITGRRIPIVADEHADPELGSGAVKITPGHDFNDFEVGKRAGFKPADMLNMFDAQAQVVQTADGLIPEALLGLDRVAARKAVLDLVMAAGALAKVEDRAIQTPYGDRSGDVIEPWLTNQWYVDAATLARRPIEAVKSGAIKIVPKTWEKTFFNWMENIQPWCVSRQLWWGHRIPAWYGPDRSSNRLSGSTYADTFTQVFVAESNWEARVQAARHYDVPVEKIEIISAGGLVPGVLNEWGGFGDDTIFILRDEDVLDTWFSSALWPFATLGWPEDLNDGLATPDIPTSINRIYAVGNSRLPGGADTPRWTAEPVHGRYPNNILISGFDILFFWDARMMMQGMNFMGEVPFRTLYLHGLVRAADGQKMSKSKGNTVDPLGLIDRYGADALRFFMAAMESQGRDIKMDEKRVEGYRNFATKLWNASRFCQANGIGGSTTLDAPQATTAVDKWIVGECVKTVQAVDLALAELRFDAAANAIYQFVWNQFCDWYLELIKPVLSDEQNLISLEYTKLSATRAVTGWVLDQILILLHPFMPFITEELWHALAPRDHDLIVARWPMPDAKSLDPEAGREVDWLIRLVSEIRSGRTELNVPPGVRLPLHVRDAGAGTKERLARNAATLARLARVDLSAGDVAGGAAQVVVDEATFVLPLEGVIDLAAERDRLSKAIAAAEKERDSLAGRLNNASFVERAKPEAVEKARADYAERAAEAERLAAALARLG